MDRKKPVKVSRSSHNVMLPISTRSHSRHENKKRRSRPLWRRELIVLYLVVASVWFVGLVHLIPPLTPPYVAAEQWTNKYSKVHVVQTRFMQYQPSLQTLGTARLLLFNSITLPSIVHQTTDEFIWIIRTDPNLAHTLRNLLTRIVSPYANVILVGSNENPEGFRCHDCIPQPEQVWSGSYALLQAYWHAAKENGVLETRLDADDALWKGYLETVQRLSVDRIVRQNDWSLWCAGPHFEWQSEAPWPSKRGSLWGIKTNNCVTAGLTWGYGTNANSGSMEVRKHQHLHEIPACGSKYGLDTQCLDRVQPQGGSPVALRARTLTSAGMDRVVLGDQEVAWWKTNEKAQNAQDSLFFSLRSRFGIEEASLATIRAFLDDHVEEVVNEALQGQCTQGHSCKEQARGMLLQRLRSKEKTPPTGS